MYKIALVEDETKESERMCKIIMKCCEELKIEVQVSRFRNGMDFITDYSPIYDLVFLDIEMPLLDGMETARKLRAVDPDVLLVFITNLAQYAIKGYEVDALDFILKPVEYKNFFNKFKKYIKYLSEKRDKYVILSSEGLLRKVNVRDILYIEIIGHFLYYHLKDGVITKYGTIMQAEQEVEQYGFFRIYKSYIVNLACIKEINSQAVIMEDGTEILISRFRKKAFMEKALDYFGNGYFRGR